MDNFQKVNVYRGFKTIDKNKIILYNKDTIKKQISFKNKKSMKNIREIRDNNAIDNMASNRDIETLTQSQHEALAEVCSIRHRLHSGMAGDLYNTNSSGYEYWMEVLDGDSTGTINTLLSDAGLKKIENIRISEELPDDYDVELTAEYMGIEREDDEEEEEFTSRVNDVALSEVYRFAEKINDNIEKYLKKIDEEHGTSYCPTGSFRI